MSRLCRCPGLFTVQGKHVTLGCIRRMDLHTAAKCRWISCKFPNVDVQTTDTVTESRLKEHHWNSSLYTLGIGTNFCNVRRYSADNKDTQTVSGKQESPDVFEEYRDKSSLSTVQKKLLVWTGCFKSEQDIPDQLRVEFLNKSFRTIFLLTWTWYMAFILMAACIMILLWKWEWTKGVEDELRSTVKQRNDESNSDYEKRFQKTLQKDIHFMRYGYELDRPGQASWLKQEVETELDPRKFDTQREKMRAKHLGTEMQKAMEEYALESEVDWEKRMEQQMKELKK